MIDMLESVYIERVWGVLVVSIYFIFILVKNREVIKKHLLFDLINKEEKRQGQKDNSELKPNV